MIRHLFFSFLALSLTCNVGNAATFQAVLSNSYVVNNGNVFSTSGATGTVVVNLMPVANPVNTTLSYQIQLNGLDLDGMQTTDAADNVTAIHFHDITRMPNGDPNPDSDTVGTRHELNIFGFPREDDADMVFDASTGTVIGLWDSSDVNPDMPATGIPADIVDELNGRKMFLMVHTTEFPKGAIGGLLIPEPGCLTLLLSGSCLLAILAGRRRS